MIESTNDMIELTTHGLLKYILKLTEMITKSDKRGDRFKSVAVKRGEQLTDLNKAYECSQERVNFLSGTVDDLEAQVEELQALAIERGSTIVQLRVDERELEAQLLHRDDEINRLISRVEELKTHNVEGNREARIQTIRADRLERVINGMNNTLSDLINDNDGHIDRPIDED